MTLRSSALFAFIVTLLATAILTVKFILDLVSALRGLTPAVPLVAAFIYALAGVGATIFFFVFQRRYR